MQELVGRTIVYKFRGDRIFRNGIAMIKEVKIDRYYGIILNIDTSRVEGKFLDITLDKILVVLPDCKLVKLLNELISS